MTIINLHGWITIRIQKLGGLIGVSPQHIILRATEKITLGNLPRLRSEVVTEDMTRIGCISDIFGPAHMPFISVRPDSIDILETIKTKPRGTLFFALKKLAPSRHPRKYGTNVPKTKLKKNK